MLLSLLMACDTPQAPEATPQAPPAEVPKPPAPPDPCRHTILEQLSPDGLAGLTGDADCMSRVALWRDQKRIWAAAADLDGDGESENIVLLAPDCSAGCTATLVIGSAAVEVPLHWPESDTFGERTLKLVDILTTDSSQEVLLRQRQSDTEDPSFANHLFTFVDGVLTESRLESEGYNQGALTLTGDGRVGVEDSTCSHHRIRWHVLKDGALSPDGEESILKPEAEHFKLPDGTYGCPG